NVYMFDWRALKRWGLKESNLPPGSVVLNRQATFWELYKRYVITGISLILLEAFLIFALLVQRARRRDAENTLAITNDRLRTAIDSGKFVVGISMLKLEKITGSVTCKACLEFPPTPTLRISMIFVNAFIPKTAMP